MGGPPGFEIRAVTIEPGGARIYHEREWLDAIVVVLRGRVELEAANGDGHRFEPGDILCLERLPLRALRNPGMENAVLVAVSRRPGSRLRVVESR